jgi:hypothetical protein
MEAELRRESGGNRGRMEGCGKKSAPSLSAAAKEADGVEWCCGRGWAAVEWCLDCVKFGKGSRGYEDEEEGWCCGEVR